MPHHAKSHQDFREMICARCFEKSKGVRVIKPKSAHLKLVQQFVYSNFTLSNESFPQGLCGACRQKLLRSRKVRFYQYNFFSIILSLGFRV
jgi:hypothetical protein